MAPLILHNVPDEERYIGDDGIQRPYAMLFPQQDGPTARARKAAGETGSFGKSTRRSRSRTGTPARREDPTIAAADQVFSSWLQQQAQNSAPQTTTGGSSKMTSTSADATEDGAAAAPAQQQRFAKKQEPCEVILRGYRSAAQQYAAIHHFEQLAGRICEDYPRDPPAEARRYKSEIRDPAYLRRQPLTPEERLRVNRPDGGEHWVKVTFESREAADLAMGASPQTVLGHLLYAEPYHGIPPTRDEAVVDAFVANGSGKDREDAMLADMFGNGGARGQRSRSRHGRTSSWVGYDRTGSRFDQFDANGSQQSSRTVDSATMTNDSSGTATSGTVVASAGAACGRLGSELDSVPVLAAHKEDDEFCRVIPTARKVKLLPADQALLPQPSLSTRVMSKVPFLKWFNGAMIGNEVPRTETGEFDWNRASLYWKLMAWLDRAIGLFQGELLNADKED